MLLGWAGFRSLSKLSHSGPLLKTFDARPMGTVQRNHTKGAEQFHFRRQSAACFVIGGRRFCFFA